MSVDPVLETGDPQAVNGYAYSDNNPINSSDPTGAMPECVDTACYGTRSSNGSSDVSYAHPANVCDSDAQCGNDSGSYGTPAEGCGSTSCADHYGGGDSYVPPAGGGTRSHPHPYVLKSMNSPIPAGYHVDCSRSDTGCQAVPNGQHSMPGPQDTIIVTPYGVCSYDEVACDLDPADQPVTFNCSGLRKFIGCTIMNLGLGCAVADCETAIRGLLSGDAADTAGTTVGDLATACANSFTADTPVTLADGKQEPISKIKVGDRVLATDPQTGVTKAEPVVALIRHSGAHDMVLVTLADGSVLDATGGHPVWDATRQTFVDASQLRAGDKIETRAGQLIRISALTYYTADLTAYNLQIDQIHTYYAGSTPVLVHNSCGYVPAGEAANYSTDELAQLTYQHVGAGDIAGRPSLEEIQNVITRGTPRQLPGQNAVQIQQGNVRVIINQDNPLRSTAYYAGH